MTQHSSYFKMDNIYCTKFAPNDNKIIEIKGFNRLLMWLFQMDDLNNYEVIVNTYAYKNVRVLCKKL